VHLPEHALSASRFSSLGGDGSFVVDGNKWEMAKNDTQLFWISVFQTLEQGKEPRTARSLKVAIFH
jgi:hypothetical protein